ncbi:MAG: hypothetical protein AB9834_00365 [Lentimicrobium sp.]
METISFEKITNEIIETLAINSLDSYYSMNHPYFSEYKLLVDKFFEKIYPKLKIGYSTIVFDDRQLNSMGDYMATYEIKKIKDTAKGVYEIGEEEKQKIYTVWHEKVQTIKNFHTQFYSNPEEVVSTLIEKYGILEEKIPTNPENNNWEKTTFKFWINYNLNVFENYESNKQKVLEISEQKNENSQKRIEELVNLSQELKIKEQNIIEEIDQIEKEVNNSEIRKADYDNRISENNKEIETIESTDGLKNKEPYLKRIQELKKINSEILKEYQIEENKIASKLISKENQLSEVESEKQECKQELDNEKKNLENINQELKLIKDDKTTVDLEKEKTYLEAIKTVFPFLQTYEEQAKLKNKTIRDTFIFYKALKPNISVKFDRMNKSINELLNGKIPSKTLNSYLGTFKYQISPLVFSNNDELVGIIFALKKCFKKENIICTDNDIYFLNVGNGIVCKFHIRENKEKLPSDIALLGSADSPSYNYTNLFSGYSNSGYLLNKGLYLITSDLIFEMYFDASPFLVSNSDIQAIVQNICDSKISADKEQEIIDRLYDDDD